MGEIKMDKNQIIKIAQEYHNTLMDLGYEIKRENREPASLNHILWMISQMAELFKQDKFEKMNRWIGFIQGALWSRGIYSVSEMREHNQ